jgi:hypothetical protein
MSEKKKLLASFNMSGRELASLMRKHKVTLRALKAKTGFTLKQIRAARKNGLSGLYAVLDWQEAIVGAPPARLLAAFRYTQKLAS